MRIRVYRWRLSDNLKSELERAARLRGVPLSVVLEQAAHVWLSQNAADPGEDEECQRELHAAADRYISPIEGLSPYDAQRVPDAVRRRLPATDGRRCAQ